jgi:DNA-directed RNA polymerase specialized sigma subunit
LEEINYISSGWSEIKSLVDRFLKKYSSLISYSLGREDFLQEAWLAKNGFIPRTPWQACIRLMNRNSLYSMNELIESKEKPLEKRFLDFDFLAYATIPNSDNVINTFIEQEYVDKKLESVGERFKKIMELYFNGYETKEVAYEVGIGESRVRHIRADGLKLLKEEVAKENKEKLKFRYVTCRHGKKIMSGGKEDSGQRKNFFT